LLYVNRTKAIGEARVSCKQIYAFNDKKQALYAAFKTFLIRVAYTNEKFISSRKDDFLDWPILDVCYR